MPALRRGQVALVGRPNVGKSTLLNRLLGETWSISSPRPQTTRRCILGVKSGPGFRLAYVDTPGLQSRYGGALNRSMQREATAVLWDGGTAAAVFLVEALRWLPGADTRVLELLRAMDLPVILAINKIDRVRPRERLLPFIGRLASMYAYAEVVPVSARTGLQVDVLERCIVDCLPADAPTPPLAECRPPLDDRRLAAELLRAELLRRLGAELPHRLSVRVEHLARSEDLVHVHACIWVESAGQKRIAVGRGGQVLKAAGTCARIRLERRWGRRVNLQTRVRVVRAWSRNAARIAELERG